jgi:hypothetical protein
MKTYTGAVDEFTKNANALIEQLPLLTKARAAHEEAMRASAEIRKVLDAEEQNLRTLMTRLERGLSVHDAKPTPDKKSPEPAKVERGETDRRARASWDSVAIRRTYGRPEPAVPQFENQLLHTQISNAIARWTDVFPPFTPIRGARYNIPIKVALRIGLLRGIRRLVSDSVPAIAVDPSRTVSQVASKMKMEAHCLLLAQFEIRCL